MPEFTRTSKTFHKKRNLILTSYTNDDHIVRVLYCIVLYCIMRPYTEGRLDHYRIGIPREFRTQPWLNEGSLTSDPYHHRESIFKLRADAIPSPVSLLPYHE